MAYSEEYFYKDDKFTSIGAFNGFPFSLSAKPSFIDMETGITTGILNREVSVNNFWNLAALEVDFVVKTNSVPSEYESGFAYNPDGTPETGHVLSIEYEVMNSYDSGEYLPEERMYREVTGYSEIQNLDASGLIQGSGSDFTSLYVTDEHDLYIPITIQPDNTGAFVITLDSGVANYFSGKSGYDSRVDKFQANMLFDFGVSTLDEEGRQFNNVDYYQFLRTGYIVPKSGFDFEVEGSRIKGIYYHYPVEELPVPVDIVMGIKPPKEAHPKMCLPPPSQPGKNGTFCIGEPQMSRSVYKKNEKGTYVCDLGDANKNFDQNLQNGYKSFPKDKTQTLKGTTPVVRRNIPDAEVRSLPGRGRRGICGNI